MPTRPLSRWQLTLCGINLSLQLEVALFAKKHSQYAAAKIFNVARRRIFDWMRQVTKINKCFFFHFIINIARGTMGPGS